MGWAGRAAWICREWLNTEIQIVWALRSDINKKSTDLDPAVTWTPDPLRHTTVGYDGDGG
eukprot:3816448-Lingulodinium_polyedra.AAC.1